MIRFLKLMIWIWIISGVIFYIHYRDFITTPLHESKVISVIPWDTIVSSLERELDFSTLYFKIYLKLNTEKQIKPQIWEYRLLKWDTIDSIIQTMSHWSMSIDEKITLLEWWNIFDIDEYLSSVHLIQKWEFISEAKNIEKYKKNYSFLENALTLEWYLYPDTYFVNPNNFSVENFNKLLLDNFKNKVYVPLLSTLTNEQINELIIISSILEKEERNISQKPTVAGILIKRYKSNWMIGADITVCYPYELTSKGCTPSFIASKVNIDKNEYNTRTKVGLPKTPINNPHIESIKASLNPHNTEYWYYLHDNNGKVYYANSNEDHNRNKRLYIK